MWKVRLETVCDIEMILDQILKENECFQLKDLAINGKDLIEIGLPQGKLVGMMLNILLNLVISDSISNDKESLLNYAKSHIVQFS
jgi:tRNA nucleotidyltransferase (CCA-adding enzyme)